MNTNLDSQKCVNCAEYKRCKEDRASFVFFMIGIISTVSIRAVTVLAHLDQLYGQVAWYVGVGGFLVFFLYKYRVDSARHRVIKEKGLVAKITLGEKLERGDRETIGSVLCALSSNKDRINYFFIFASSVLALAIAVYFDFLK